MEDYIQKELDIIEWNVERIGTIMENLNKGFLQLTNLNILEIKGIESLHKEFNEAYTNVIQSISTLQD